MGSPIQYSRDLPMVMGMQDVSASFLASQQHSFPNTYWTWIMF